MNKSRATINIFLEKLRKKPSKRTINLYLRIIKIT